MFDKREGLRWWFVDTERPMDRYMLSLYPKDFKYLLINGIYLLFPPFTTNHIRGIWG